MVSKQSQPYYYLDQFFFLVVLIISLFKGPLKFIFLSYKAFDRLFKKLWRAIAKHLDWLKTILKAALHMCRNLKIPTGISPFTGAEINSGASPIWRWLSDLIFEEHISRKVRVANTIVGANQTSRHQHAGRCPGTSHQTCRWTQ